MIKLFGRGIVLMGPIFFRVGQDIKALRPTLSISSSIATCRLSWGNRSQFGFRLSCKGSHKLQGERAKQDGCNQHGGESVGMYE